MVATAPATLASRLEERPCFIEAGGNTTHPFGLGHRIGRSYALLHLTPRPLSLGQIASEPGVRKASASVTLRQLAELRAARTLHQRLDRLLVSPLLTILEKAVPRR